MGLDSDYTKGQTPFEEEEKEGLLIPTISTRGELDEYEQQNIEHAILWLYKKSFTAEKVLNEKFIKELHKKMYGEVWKWAGGFRTTEKNIGINKSLIVTQLKTLCDDTIFWKENKTFPPDEITIRFKHRLVSIQCFPNGNGRHSRLMADIIIEKIFKRPVFSWGAANLIKKENSRADYFSAIKAADAGNIKPLMEFARS